jgi:TRAP-type mannitol/chloroaromatic compound transport system substrate-binding protein
MKRRHFMTTLAAGAAGVALARPAVAQAYPEVKWRLTSSFPKALDLLFGATTTLAKQVSDATDGKFQIEPFAAGEIVPALQALDAVSSRNVELCHTATYLFAGKDPALALGCAVPFGLNARQQNAWLHEGGTTLFNELLKKHGVMGFPGGNTGAQMGGWFRKEVKDVAELRGLKFRIGGLAGQVLAKLGAAPQQVSGGDIYPALERGTLDAAEWIGPYDDDKLGFAKVARFYYYPGWWEGGVASHFLVNLQKWSELPEPYQAAFTNAAAYVNTDVLAKYDARNPAALKRIVAGGAQLRPFSAPIMEAGLKAWNELAAELSGANPDFKRIYDNLTAFKNDQYLWAQVAEYSFDSFQIRNRTRG